MPHKEHHKSHRSGWLRAAVMGANDGIVSTASLIIGVAAANTEHNAIILAGLAGLVAGAMSMAAGEYVSVCSQADIEQADLNLEKEALKTDYEHEKLELAAIYQRRGLEPALSKQVAEQLMAHDALQAHARDEIGITDTSPPRPVQAALASAATFTAGAALPLITAALVERHAIIPATAAFSLLCLASLGTLAAHVGGAPRLRGALRVLFWGTLAMLITATVGHFFQI